ncbi:hypothetical protein Vadar_008773 [Vaccinium darrowii]|uniref:Uncharacterized protein n=1 Tax=Vaccinium darrowii TaxID=229202 RepID=A0ACB7XZ77_9ERIC|nr:hypothetical protein Vadar_008773 [Vaccinium darrowii]
MFSPACEVLLNIKEDGTCYKDRGAANAAHRTLTSFEFVFILHLMHEIMKITDVLCQALQRKTQDLINALHLVSSTKSFLQKLRDEGWDPLIAKVRSFCVARTMDIPDMSVRYIPRQGRARGHQDEFTIEHYYQRDVFCSSAVGIQFLTSDPPPNLLSFGGIF